MTSPQRRSDRMMETEGRVGAQIVSSLPHSIHHVNFPSTDPKRTEEWYCKVFSMKRVDPKSNTDVLLLTRGNFDLHFPRPGRSSRRHSTKRSRLESR